MGKLDSKVAIVTGSGRGIGRAIATKLADEGARIVVNDLDEEPARETVETLEKAGHEAHAVVGDVAAEDFGERIVSETLEHFGALDILVNNAGYIWNTAIQNHSDEQWYAMLDVHATGPFRILRAAAHHFRETGKRERAEGVAHCRKVVNISSVAGTTGGATQLAYSAGKAAVVGITKTLAKEWGRYNVTVNCVAFGYIETRLTQSFEGAASTISVKERQFKVGFDRSAIQALEHQTPLGRSGTTEEAAGAVYLLCLPESDFITGQVLHCCGGIAM